MQQAARCGSGLIVLATALAGCAAENPASLRDTTGAEIGWSCESGSCVTVQESFSPRVPAGCGVGTEHLVGAGAVAILCAASRGPDGTDVVHERTCRPIACGDELDCPQWEARGYACAAGVCRTDVGLALDRVDMAALCLFDVDRHESCGAAEDDREVDRRMALVDSVCDAAGCARIPEGCLALE